MDAGRLHWRLSGRATHRLDCSASCRHTLRNLSGSRRLICQRSLHRSRPDRTGPTNPASQPARLHQASPSPQQQFPSTPPQGHPGRSMQQSAAATLQNARPALIGGGLFLGGTLLVAIIRLIRKNMSPEYKRKRSVGKNQLVVETLKQYLPDNRMGLDNGVIRMIRRSTGFSSEEVFRKYLWFLLRERAFDQAAVDDLVLLKGMLQLSEEQIAAALRERAQRVYDRYGNVMLEVKGLSKAGIDRKATCRQLFSKILYLSEQELLISEDGPAANAADIPGVFGATEDDTAKLRIVSLNEVDFDVLEAQFLPDQDRPPGPPVV
ncbi:hypothetical protein WJX73_000090 [Symbiochloris irregularis]|uniref:Armadillo-like repeats domain-containing protein n=1 Tax=Symbiochloris irregularis TaxID=706552 RepID=A0AAW1PW72_9CHLO